MKSVMISIRPECCELIASGKKTVEVRKTRPKISTPFKCYIYCTKPRMVLRFVDEKVFCKTPDGSSPFCSPPYSGKVIGEFVCENIQTYVADYFIGSEMPDGTIRDKPVEGEYAYWIPYQGRTCLSYTDIKEYGKGKTLYGWYISNLKLYDKPKELSEFRRPCQPNCNAICNIGCPMALERPPQSWCYCTQMSVVLD